MKRIVSSPAVRNIVQFARHESGGVATDLIVMTAAVVGLCMAAMIVISGGVEDFSGEVAEELASNDAVFSSHHFGDDRATVLAESDLQYFNEGQIRSRYDRWSDPEQRTDDQLRNAHRTWSRRLADPDYADPDRASDLVLMFEAAMDARGVDPHDNI